MGHWIFQGSRKDFDIDSYLSKLKYIYWAVRYEKHQKEIRLGDDVFIWRAKGNTKDPYGLVAYGKVVEIATHKDNVLYPDYLLEKYWNKREVSPIKVGIEIEEVRLSLMEGLVESTLLLRDEKLKKMQLLTTRQGSNFKLEEEEFFKVRALWNGYSESLDILDESEYGSDESTRRIKTHMVRERDPKLVKKAKAAFFKKYGRLYCEVCNYDFLPIYGFSYVEVHHKKALKDIKSGEETKLKDLAIVCANCHRAVHRIDSEDPWSDLLEIYDKI
ncbi:EVE domain-containing protein [Providencia rettgeri]|uniref:EVE domain-containing protein n=1 Tax=Providencia rettgeri TaxID=587 RepID=UPI000907D362|nr:EVE domain-containing protein [Providencia rettgeri]